MQSGDGNLNVCGLENGVNINADLPQLGDGNDDNNQNIGEKCQGDSRGIGTIFLGALRTVIVGRLRGPYQEEDVGSGQTQK